MYNIDEFLQYHVLGRYEHVTCLDFLKSADLNGPEIVIPALCGRAVSALATAG